MNNGITIEVLGIYYLPNKPLRCTIEMTRAQWIIFFFATPEKRRAMICKKLEKDERQFREFTWMPVIENGLPMLDELVDASTQYPEVEAGHIPYEEFREKVFAKVQHMMKGWDEKDKKYALSKQEETVQSYFRDYCNEDVNSILEGGTAKSDIARARYWIRICVEFIEMNGLWSTDILKKEP